MFPIFEMSFRREKDVEGIINNHMTWTSWKQKRESEIEKGRKLLEEKSESGEGECNQMTKRETEIVVVIHAES